MEEEIKNLTSTWLIVLASLTYCHQISRFIPKGTTRLCSFIPILMLFLYLPLNLNTFTFGCTISFFISWLANFKLLLFAFGRGPLSATHLSFGGFLLLACLPIRIKDVNLEREKVVERENEENLSLEKSTLGYAVKLLLLVTILVLYMFRDTIHPKLMLLLCCFHIYLSLELLLALVAALARALTRLELEPEFVDPYLASSLQNFWGKRWNLVVVSTLQPTVYVPVRSMARSLVGEKWASLPAVLGTFLVSGAMHEVIFCQVGRTKPTFEVMSFFLLHGVCLAVEICIKKVVNGRFSLPRFVSGPLVILFVAFTSSELLVLPVIKRELIDLKVRREANAALEFVKMICHMQ